MGSGIVCAAGYRGLHAVAATVEVVTTDGTADFRVEGLSETARRELLPKLRAAVVASGYAWAPKRVQVIVRPSAVAPSEGTYALAVAMAWLIAEGHVPQAAVQGWTFLADLTLTAALRAVPGVLAAAHSLLTAHVLVAPDDAPLVASVPSLRVVSAPTLAEAVAGVCGRDRLPAWPSAALATHDPDAAESARAVSDDKRLLRALAVAAAGGHPLLLLDGASPGRARAAARALGALFPPWSARERHEVGAIHSIARLLHGERPVLGRPFRAPASSASVETLCGVAGRPGECALAHGGVLFLDGVGEFSTAALDAVLDGTSTHPVVVPGVGPDHLSYPTDFLLVASQPTAAFGTPVTDERRARTFARLLDRVHLFVPVLDGLARTRAGDEAEVEIAALRRTISRAAHAAVDARGVRNARLGAAFDLQAPAARALQVARTRLGPFSLAATREGIVRAVARTLADLDGAREVGAAHVEEAVELAVVNPLPARAET